ncbi:Acyl-CoA-binding domain-containing protein 5 [Apophysomyces sp. BC1015]|nr:Acyl-CoA-binding domain-containing protein 5 [Apophysomyces sp. BC1015]
MDTQKQVWLWGGSSVPPTDDNHTTFYNSWEVIDTKWSNKRWKNWTYTFPTVLHDIPPARVDHTATLIFETHILIIGGMVYTHDVTSPNSDRTLNPTSMNTLLLFDTVSATWRTITASGNVPAPRGGHSAVLRPGDESIVVFGGGTSELGENNTALNDVFILQLQSMQWTAPIVGGVPPEPRKDHQACLVSTDQMLVLFGRGNDQIAYSDVNILSISTWSWVSLYTPDPAWLAGNRTSSVRGVTWNSSTVGEAHGNSRNPDSSTTFGNSSDVMTEEGNTSASSSRITAGIIAGVISAGVVAISGGVFLVLSVIVYGRRQQRQNQAESGQSDSSSFSSFVLSPISQIKPDHRSSIHTLDTYVTRMDDGTEHKPNARDE